MEREAANQGLCCNDYTGFNLAGYNASNPLFNDTAPLQWNSTMWKKSVGTSGIDSVCKKDKNGDCAFTKCTHSLMERATSGTDDISLTDFLTKLSDGSLPSDRWTDEEKDRKGSNRKLVRLSCFSNGEEGLWFDLMNSYGDMGNFLSIISLVGIILYFVTSSDSGSLVIDCLSANGDPDPPIIQVRDGARLIGRLMCRERRCVEGAVRWSATVRVVHRFRNVKPLFYSACVLGVDRRGDSNGAPSRWWKQRP